MSTVIISCKTLQNELEKACREVSCRYPVFWLEAGLHNVPAHLTEAIREQLAALPAADTVLLAMGFCGNALIGIHTGEFRMIVPRVDDCISLMLGSVARRQGIMREEPSYFLTKGWLDGETNIWRDYQYACRKYGERRGRAIYKTVLAPYKRLAVIDTGAYQMDAITPQTKKIAETLGLRHDVLMGDSSLLKQLLTGPWTEEKFLMIPPNATVGMMDLMKSY
jgi:hypothetical protein